VLLATTGTALTALSVVSRALQSRVRAQLAGAVATVSRGDLALNGLILQNVRSIIGAEVVTFGPGGGVVATTVTDDRRRLIEAAESVIRNRPADGDSVGVVTADCGVPCMIAYRDVDARPDTVVALIADTSELTAATSAVTRAIVLGATLSAVLMMLVGQLVVRRVTAPLQRLVTFVGGLTPSDVNRRAVVTNDEIGALAEAFNGLLDRLQASQSALVRTEKLALAGLLAARVAHDVRNPLSSIKMQTQLLQARLRDDPEDQATLTSVVHDINQVESVIADLVELARPGDLKREPTSINRVIHDALRQLSPQLLHRKIVTRTKLSVDVPDIPADSRRLRQALLNVLVNASEAMATGGGIDIDSRLEGPNVVVEICDDGCGIDPQVVGRVFDPFVSTKREGVGLGLVNAKSVIEGHGGWITLQPRRPKGTCARITLPVDHG
jgi:signal transduction histidine kinase